MLTVSLLSCGGQKNTTQSVMKETQDTDQMPKPGPAPKIHFSKPIVYKLNNGMKIIIVENHKLPRVTANLNIDTPPFNLKDKKGADDLLSSMLGTGSKNVNKDEFNEKIDFYGARVNLNEGGFYINALSKFFPEVFKLTVDQALNPNFTEEEFQTKKKELIEGLKMQEKSTPAAASNVLKKLAYGKHPYGEITTIDNVEKIKKEDVENYYSKVYDPSNAYLIIVGDVKAEEIKKMAENYFNNWESVKTKPAIIIPKINNVPKTEVDFVNMPHASQAELKVAHRSDVTMGNPDYHKVLLMNSILGGDFNSYLNMTLREKHGWTYGARSHFGTNKYGALFNASTSVRNSVADSATVVTMNQLNKIRDEKVDEEFLNNTKQKYMGNFVLQMENPTTIARQAYNIYVNNLPEDFYETFLQKIESVTSDDIQQVANKYLHPDQARIIIAGKASEIVPGLKEKGYTIKFFDKEGNPVKAPKTNTAIPQNLKTDDVINNYFKAIGGIEKIKDIKSVEMIYEGNFQGNQLQISKKAMAPNKVISEVKMMGMTLSKEYFDGEKGYRESRGQKFPMTDEMIKEKQLEPQPFPVMGLYKTAKLERKEKIDGKDYYVLKTKNAEYYFDAQTGLLKQIVESQEMNGKVITQATNMSDYKEYNGVKFPETITLPAGPQEIILKLKDVKLNSLNESEFK
jgi:predicted Zn-dependent peptidase